ncbi:MAG: hypothetical protein J0L75_00195 [Spirochaetes bacterium]|nr:hypothetical protein [Spirochaetota bacterium]
MFKKILLVVLLFAALAALALWQGWIAVTPEGRAAGRAALGEGKSQAKRAAAWTLEALFEK